MKKKPIATISKIEIDAKTQEPYIVELDERSPSVKAQIKRQRVHKIKLSSNKMKEPDMIYGTQLAMKQVFIPVDDSTNKKHRILKRVFAIGFFILLLAVIGFTAYKDFFDSDQSFVSWERVGIIFKTNWYYFLLAIFALFCSYFFKGFKMSVLCKSLTGKWHLKTCLETGIIGHYYNNVTPLGAGGQPFEIYYLSRHGVTGGVAAALPIAAFFMYQFSFLILGVLCVISLTPDVDFFNLAAVLPELFSNSLMGAVRPMAIIGLVFAMLMPTLVLVFSIMPRFCSKCVHLIVHIGGKLKLVKKPKITTYKTMKNVVHNTRCIKAIVYNPLILIITLLIGFCEEFSVCSIAYFTLKFFGFDWVTVPGFTEWILVTQICIVLYSAISFIPTPGNSGAADLSFFWLFSTGLAAGFAFPAMMTWRILSYYAFVLVGFAFARTKRKLDKKREVLANLQQNP